jgi:hypothetical protein
MAATGFPRRDAPHRRPGDLPAPAGPSRSVIEPFVNPPHNMASRFGMPL